MEWLTWCSLTFNPSGSVTNPVELRQRIGDAFVLGLRFVIML